MKPTTARPRMDLDGVTLHDAAGGDGHPLAVLRYRTTAGLVLLIPESADFLVPWEDLEEVGLDLRAGEVRVRIREGYAQANHWLRGARELVGQWTDRCELKPEALGL